ncbi:His-Xaa-Ser system radical SAM maturase HxsB [Providencia huaxiensis]|uniref:His-Xaa-Ser system radical SAM maturase HxsB n=1 Tax=Providencia TaxID=586 RepID=UPI000F7A43E1|nr:His-Xaa-Ser system radical SAM maturase HxsB [Providencia rettgeri]MBV2190589.1 His-Xaa-Ser system radical SAM maturase HxsB [Providencia rettgeri]HEC8322369.1 His-Xaa-Ser system radical SAM maturase HxsB [Providencia rettgeri]
MIILPFNFERISEQDTFISNLAGYSLTIKNEYLDELIHFGVTSNEGVNKKLANNFFICNDVFLAEKILASAVGKKLLNETRFSPIFMVVPTLRCDHTCKYCQVSRASLNAEQYDLNEKLIPLIISLIKKLSSKPYKIEIQGGEPLLRFDLIEKIYQEAANALGEENIEFIITSSLSLLSDEMIDWSKDKPVFYSVSLDGTELIHNKNRVLPQSNSYQIVVKNIKKLQKAIGKCRVATVTTVTKALLDDPLELLLAHQEVDIFDMFIRPISPYGFAKSKNDYTIEEYLVFYEQLLELIIHFNEQGIPFVEHSAAIHIKRLKNVNFAGYADLKSPSGLIFNSLLFNYDGKLYGSDESRMLQKVFPDVDFAIGDIESLSFTHNPIYHKILSDSLNMLQVGCDKCAFQPFCGSDPCQNISLFGEPVGDKSLSRFCSYHKGMFKLLIRKIEESTVGAKILKGWSYV